MDQMFAFQLSLVLTTRAARDVLSFASQGNGESAGSEAEARERGAQALSALLPAAIAKIPESGPGRGGVRRGVAVWLRSLGVLEPTAKARQFSVTYKAFRRGPVESHLIFTLDGGREPIAWDKLRSVVDEPLEVRERRGPVRKDTDTGAASGPADEDDSDDWLLGAEVDSSPERNEVRIALDDDVVKLLEHRSLALPRTAALVYKASGD